MRDALLGVQAQDLDVATDATPDDVEKLFDGFWRKDKSRTDRHAGLGLTLSRSFAQAMGWTLTARLGADGIVVFTLRQG